MEPTDDPNLRKLLREWTVEDAPRSLDERVLGRAKPWWSFLLTGSMRIPVPVALALALVLVAMGAALVRQRSHVETPRVAAEVNLADFRPVEDVQVRIIRGQR